MIFTITVIFQMTIILDINFNIAHPLSVHTFAIIYRTPQGILIHEKSFAAEFSSEDVVMYSTNASADSVAVQLHVSLPPKELADQMLLLLMFCHCPLFSKYLMIAVTSLWGTLYHPP